MHNYRITREQWNYMLPVPGFRQKMWWRDLPNGDQAFYFFGDREDYLDFLGRCKYLYDPPEVRS